MKQSCPISIQQVDEKTARINGGVVVVLCLISLLTGNPMVIVVIMSDFFIKGLIRLKYSPISLIISKIIMLLKIEQKKINAGPKIFAAKIGFLFSLIIIVLQLLHYPKLSNAIACVLMFCAFLEFSINYCIACKIYSSIVKDK